MLDKIVRALEDGEEVIENFLSALLSFQKEVGFEIISETDHYTLAELIDATEVIPFSDDRLLKFQSDQLRDGETFRAWALEKMYEKCGGRHGQGGPKLTFEKWAEPVLMPDEIIHEVIAGKYALMYWLRSWPKGVDLTPFFSISNGTVEVLKDAREKLIDQYTVYATDSQTLFFAEATKALQALSSLEEKFRCPGLIQRALSNNGTNYALNLETLTELKP